MNIRQSLIDAAARSGRRLGSGVEDVAAVLKSYRRSDGGFSGKDSESDLYYTGFACLSLLALDAEADFSQTVDYLVSLGTGSGLDLAHLAALIRQRRLLMDQPFDDALNEVFLNELARFRCDDGSFHHVRSQASGSAYGCFLAIGAWQDLGIDGSDEVAESILQCVQRLKDPGGGYFNEAAIPAVSVPATAAAMMVRQILTDTAPDTDAIQWLMTCLDGGGFRVMPMAPVADLLSTAVALHSLSTAGVDLSAIRKDCLNFVKLLWDEAVGFCANPYDRISDPEYIFYGLLALGNLCGDNA